MSSTRGGNRFPGKGILLRVFRLSPNSFAFLGGVFISVAVNLYTGVYATDALPMRWLPIVCASVAALISSFFWTAIAWILEPLRSLALSQSPDWMDPEEVWERLLSPELPKLMICLVIACAAAIQSILFLHR